MGLAQVATREALVLAGKSSVVSVPAAAALRSCRARPEASVR
jgi:hypothetical protein